MRARDPDGTSEYRVWQRDSIRVGGRSFDVATKPGLVSHARDPAAVLLAEHVTVARGDAVVYLNGGNGLPAVVAATVGAAGQVLLTDRNVVAAEAARRTMAMHGVTNATVALQHGAGQLLPSCSADTVAIRIPHEKHALLQLLRDAFGVLRAGGRCYISGATDDGVKSAARALASLFGNAQLLEAGGGYRVVVATKTTAQLAVQSGDGDEPTGPDQFREVRTTLRDREYVLSTRPGVFSWEHVDEATQILARTMEIGTGDSVLDLGCGCGALGVVAASLSPQQVCLVDVDVEAVRSATRTAVAAGLGHVRVLASDVTDAVRDDRFDVVVSNPPFHLGKETALDLPAEFIRQAHDVLRPGGRLMLVANRTLPYERVVTARFGHVHTMHDGARFKVLLATKG